MPGGRDAYRNEHPSMTTVHPPSVWASTSGISIGDDDEDDEVVL